MLVRAAREISKFKTQLLKVVKGWRRMQAIQDGVAAEPQIKLAEAGKKNGKRSADDMMTSSPIPTSPDQRSIDEDEHVDVDDEEDMAQAKTERLNDAQEANANIDEYVTNEHDSDDEIADVDFSGDEADKGPNAAEALRAQVVAQQIEKQQTSSSSGTSGSGSSGSGSGSGSSSSDSEGSDDDSASSGGDS